MLFILFRFLKIEILLEFINNLDDTKFMDSIIYSKIDFKNITYTLNIPIEDGKNLLYNMFERKMFNIFIECNILDKLDNDMYDNYQRYCINANNMYILLDVRRALIRYNIIPFNDNIVMIKTKNKYNYTYTFNINMFISRELLSLLLNHLHVLV